MDNVRVLQGDLLARDLRFTIVASRFNELIVESLVRAAIDTLLRHGANEKQIELVRVPGAFDLPLVAKRVATSRRCDAIIALGAVIRGGTPHFDYVAGQCAAGLAGVSQEQIDTTLRLALSGLPVGLLRESLCMPPGNEAITLAHDHLQRHLYAPRSVLER